MSINQRCGTREPVHVCIITTAHAIDDMRVNHKFADAFRAAGFRVTWVGPGHANYDIKEYNQHGIDFVLGHPLKTRLDRLLASHRIRPIVEKVAKADVYYAPDPDSAQLALMLAKKNGAKVIFDIHEIYHGALLDRWLLGLRINPIRKFMRNHISRIAEQCDLVIGVSNTVLVQYASANVNKVVIRSCAPSWFAKGQPADVCNPKRKSFTIMHGKNHHSRGTMQVVDAAASSFRHIPELRIIMFDSGYNNTNEISYSLLKSRIKELGVSNVIDLRPGIPMQEMPFVLQSCDVGIIAYGRNLGVDSLPNRFFEYMAIGLPIIAPSYATEIAAILKNEKCGMLVDCENPVDIAKAFIQLRRNPDMCREMGKRSRDAFLARHNWETEVRPVIDWIQKWSF